MPQLRKSKSNLVGLEQKAHSLVMARLSQLLTSKEFQPLTPRCKNALIDITVARVLACNNFEMPTNMVSPVEHYTLTIEGSVVAVVDEVNSTRPLNVDSVLELTKQFYLTRARIAIGTANCDETLDYLGRSTFLPGNVLEIIETYKEVIC